MDTCDSGTCKCGTAAACSGATDTCTSGACKCGAADACSGASDTCTSGACKCGTAEPCAGPLSNICTGSACKCGSSAACTAGTLGTCLAADATTPTSTDTTATCKCSGDGEEDSCYKSSNAGYDSTKPICGDGTCGTLGECVACSEFTDKLATGTGTKQGTCPKSTEKCCPNGSCADTC